MGRSKRTDLAACIGLLILRLELSAPKTFRTVLKRLQLQVSLSSWILHSFDTCVNPLPISPAGLQWLSKMDLFLFMWLIILGVMGVMTFAGVFILLVPVIDPERSGSD